MQQKSDIYARGSVMQHSSLYLELSIMYGEGLFSSTLASNFMLRERIQQQGTNIEALEIITGVANL